MAAHGHRRHERRLRAIPRTIIAWLAGVDLRNVRPICRPDRSPPMRVRRQRRDVRALGMGPKVSVAWNHRDSGLEGTFDMASPIGDTAHVDKPRGHALPIGPSATAGPRAGLAA